MGKIALGALSSHILLALGVSAVLLGLLVHTSLGATDLALVPEVFAAIGSVSGKFLAAYLLAIGFRTVLQTVRYQLIVGCTEPALPRFRHFLLVTASRNMFVDMLPARLGELSYVSMLNRGYRVSLSACLTSLAVSFVFDLVALGIIIGGIILQQLLTHGVRPWIIGTLLGIGLLVLVLSWLLFPGLRWAVQGVERLASWRQCAEKSIINRFAAFLRKVVNTLATMRQAGIMGRLLLLSLGVRLGKYLGYYAVFYGVASVQFPQVSTRLSDALIALISAEAGASMPLPAFLGFGSYEAAGMLALMTLGADRAASLLMMLSVHIWSQIMDYGLGGVALAAFFITTSTASRAEKAPGRTIWYSWYTALALLLFLGGGVFAGKEWLAMRKLGSLRPPVQGQAVVPVIGQAGHDQRLLGGLHGFAVWSSNRSGNHDIWMMHLPDQQLKQLTTHPHTEYFPRIAPDGTRIVFARSKQPWASQRNTTAWDIIVLDLQTGQERELAKDGNVPTWSADGRKVYFQRNANQLVELEVASGKQTVVWQSGLNLELKPSVTLENPAVAPKGGAMAVTLRGGMRATAIIDPTGKLRLTGDGCQLNWAPDGSYLYKVDHGGRQKNAIYRVDPEALTATPWFDAPGEYSHEYFPKLDNSGSVLVYGASSGGHEHDTADYEIFLWPITRPAAEAVRLTYHTGNDCWPDIYLADNKQ